MMHKISIWKALLVLAISFVAIIFTAPSFFDKKILNVGNKINLGLDLKGGSHLLLEVDFESYIKDQMEMLIDVLRKDLRQNKIPYRLLTAEDGAISFIAANLDLMSQIKNTVSKIDKNLEITTNQNKISLSYSKEKMTLLLNDVIEQSMEIIRRRVDSSGTKEPIIQRQGLSYILLQVPGMENPTEIKQILGKTAKLTFHLLDLDSLHIAQKGGKVLSDAKLVKQTVGDEEFMVAIKKRALLSGDLLTSAEVAINNNNQPTISISFNNLGSKLFADATQNNVGKQLAIVLDDNVLSAPNINEKISGGKAVISGNFTMASAHELALLLRAGALPAPLKVVEERSIGPNLGLDSIESGKKASLIAFVAVGAFMILAYGAFGIFANVALLLNILYIFAMLSLFNATLTLPGIAGIILTMGMAVDANVLIYERIREELKLGVTNAYAVKKGFESAFSTIADSNITTLAAAILLYIFGVGTIKGFAVTLSIGIVASMFTAISVTRLQIDLWLKLVKPKKLLI